MDRTCLGGARAPLRGRWNRGLQGVRGGAPPRQGGSGGTLRVDAGRAAVRDAAHLPRAHRQRGGDRSLGRRRIGSDHPRRGARFARGLGRRGGDCSRDGGPSREAPGRAGGRRGHGDAPRHRAAALDRGARHERAHVAQPRDPGKRACARRARGPLPRTRRGRDGGAEPRRARAHGRGAGDRLRGAARARPSRSGRDRRPGHRGAHPRGARSGPVSVEPEQRPHGVCRRRGSAGSGRGGDPDRRADGSGAAGRGPGIAHRQRPGSRIGSKLQPGRREGGGDGRRGRRPAAFRILRAEGEEEGG